MQEGELIMEWWHIYLFTRLDVVGGILLGAVLAASMLVLIVVILTVDFYVDGDKDEPFLKVIKKSWTKILAAYLFVVFLFAAIPTQKEAAAIYMLPKLINSGFAKEMQQLPEEFASALRVKLEAWVDEMVDDRKED